MSKYILRDPSPAVDGHPRYVAIEERRVVVLPLRAGDDARPRTLRGFEGDIVEIPEPAEQRFAAAIAAAIAVWRLEKVQE